MIDRGRSKVSIKGFIFIVGSGIEKQTTTSHECNDQ